MATRHLIMVALMIALLGGGLVELRELLFFLCSLPYVYFLASFVFPARSSSPVPQVFRGERESRALGFYVLGGAVVGLALPVPYIIWNFIFDGDEKRRERIKAAAAHLFLLAGQVFAEGLTFSGAFSLPIRAFVPICFNTRRLFTIADWLRFELAYSSADMSSSVGISLAAANLLFWSFNLLGFLLPVYLPRVLNIHYGRTSAAD